MFKEEIGMSKAHKDFYKIVDENLDPIAIFYYKKPAYKNFLKLKETYSRKILCIKVCPLKPELDRVSIMFW